MVPIHAIHNDSVIAGSALSIASALKSGGTICLMTLFHMSAGAVSSRSREMSIPIDAQRKGMSTAAVRAQRTSLGRNGRPGRVGSWLSAVAVSLIRASF
jgi:hypothetical protein